VTLKDGGVFKGVVVEEYHDRIVLSTYEGEKFLKKSNIMGIAYDTEVQNLIWLAELALESAKYQSAYAYYDKASKIEPHNKKVKDGKIYLQTLLFKKEVSKKQAEIDRRANFENQRTPVIEPPDNKEKVDRLKEELGMRLKMGAVNPQVMEVVSGSSAHQAGLERGDYIVAVWGRLTGYMNIKQVLSLLLEKAPKERKLTIERVIRVKINKDRGFLPDSIQLMGAGLSMELDGLTVSLIRDGEFADMAGLRKGDLIVAIDGSPTRYMPLQVALEMIHTAKRNSTKFTIRRDVSLW
jgi:C-terminal processing protease CtpA/Prc